MEFTARLPGEVTKWLHALAKAEDATLSATVMQVLEDIRTWWDLPEKDVALLLEDASRLQLSQRDYLYHLLAQRMRARARSAR